MRFLLDQDVHSTTARFLTELGHDVLPASAIGGSRASDELLLSLAYEDSRILVTRDRDFGSLVFLQRKPGSVIYLRLLPSTQQAVHSELKNILSLYSDQEFDNAFIVVEPGKHRFRKLTGSG